MRGKGVRSGTFLNLSGITPAYAGKRVNFTVTHNAVWDHPRLCGEKGQIMNFNRKFKGSPPPMRGKGFFYLCLGSFVGITPAYAGKSSRSVGTKSISKDHPRLCGEKFTDPPLALAGEGSPPPMRGKDG